MKFLMLMVGAAILTCAASAQAHEYTKETAPDPVSKSVLAHPLVKLDQGAPAGVDASPTIHRNFTQIIEQNFAQLDSLEAGRRLDALSEAELSDLAQLYINAASDNGQPARLFNVLAVRLDSVHLARVSRHFGFVATYSGITASAPQKIQAFLAQAPTSSLGPTPGELRFGPSGRFARTPSYVPAKLSFDYGPSLHPAVYEAGSRKMQGRIIKTIGGGYGQFLNYTPYEIYLSFRTAPIGALGVTGALYETTVVLSNTLIPAYATGYAIGTYVVNPLINTYAPNLGDAIGGTIAGIVETLSNSWAGGTNSAGAAQQSTVGSFQPTAAQLDNFSTLGGDFGATVDFASYLAGGGNWCRLSRCPPMELH